MRAIVLAAMLAGPAHADGRGEVPVTSPADEAAVRARLAGHTVAGGGDRVQIVDVAGEGAPWVGVVERRGRGLWLVPASGAPFELRGPLARPRLAGPGYTIWVLGDLDEPAARMQVRRLGVLRAPGRGSGATGGKWRAQTRFASLASLARLSAG